MPHIQLEYSANIVFDKTKLQEVFKDIHMILSEVADLHNCKSRATQLTDFYIGDGANDLAFVSLQIAMLKSPQRTDSVKEALLKRIVEVLELFFLPITRVAGLRCKPTAEIRNLEVYLTASVKN